MSSAAEPRADRKLLKPLMEKRRRDRMNRSLDRLRLLLLAATRDERLRNPKVEKAEILQKTLRFLRAPPRSEPWRTEQLLLRRYRSGYRECLARAARFLQAPPPPPPCPGPAPAAACPPPPAAPGPAGRHGLSAPRGGPGCPGCGPGDRNAGPGEGPALGPERGPRRPDDRPAPPAHRGLGPAPRPGLGPGPAKEEAPGEGGARAGPPPRLWRPWP